MAAWGTTPPQEPEAARRDVRRRGWCSRKTKHSLPLKLSIQRGGERREAPSSPHYAGHFLKRTRNKPKA